MDTNKDKGSGSWRIKSSNSKVKLDREQLRDIPKPERKLGLFRFEAGSHAAQVDLKVDTELKMTSNF